MSLYVLLVPGYVHMLRGLSAQLKKGLEWAAEAEVPEQDFLSARLAPDMHPLRDQVRFVCYQARDGIRRLTDRHVPEPDSEPATLSQLDADIAATLALLDDITEAEFAGAQDREVEIALPDGMVFDLSGSEYARDWALPQAYFHAVTAYAIMRAQGVGLGKADYVSHMFAYLRNGDAEAAG